MPSIRKRIGYLPSINIQEIISNIAKKEKLSQSKVVGILVQEALIARGVFDLKNKNDSVINSKHSNKTNIDNTFFRYGDFDELISDKGITYNNKKYNHSSDDYSSEHKQDYNEDLFALFKQFILFKKMIEEEK